MGMAAGAALAILFAPQLGEGEDALAGDTSDDLLKRGQLRYDHLSTQLRARYGDAFELGREAYTRAKGEVLTRYNKAKAGE